MNSNEKIRITNSQYRNKLLGCWIGKSVGGTLGGPYEGKPGPLSLTFYDPVPTEMLPNDDLDLQVVWLETIRRRGFPVNRFHLAGAWLENIHLWPDEYGVATRNLIHGIYPPAGGAYDNKFTAGMGAAIRSELWACLAPGDPELAVRMAREDACVDHDGEGLDAALFLTALESLAFIESDPDTLIDRALSFISNDGRLARGIADTRYWAEEAGLRGDSKGSSGDGGSRQPIREKILAAHAPQNWTDVVPNLCFIVLGWLAGRGDFGRSICTAVNCGLDTDCTGATLGALLGIIDPDSIGKDWTEPIGMDLVLSPGMVGMHHADTLNEFSDQVAEAAVNALAYYGSSVEIPDSIHDPASLKRWGGLREITGELPRNADREALIAVDPLPVTIEYPEDTVFLPGATSTATITVRNPGMGPGDTGIESSVQVSVPDGWKVSPETARLQIDAGESAAFDLRITPPEAPGVRSYRNMLDLRFGTGQLNWTVSAGLPQPIPWRRRPAAAADSETSTGKWEAVESPRHYQPVPAGGWIYETDVKIPFRGTFIFVTQGARPAVTYLDGEKINEYDGSFYVPAMHRNNTGSEIYCDRGWHRIRIAVAAEEDTAGGQDSDNTDTELFFGIGIRASFGWITELEWRIPKR